MNKKSRLKRIMVLILFLTMVLSCFGTGGVLGVSNAQELATATDSEVSVVETGENEGESFEYENTYNSENFDVNFKLDSVWDAGYNATITITNTSDSVIENWYLTFPLNETISNIWNASISETHEDFYVIKNAGWNQDIAVGGSVSFGITVYEPFTEYPEYYTILGNEVEMGSEDYTVDYKITEDWGEGYKAEVTITNNKDVAIEDWRLVFDYGDNLITQIWNAVIVANIEGKYELSCETYNQNIAPGASVTFGFMVEPGCSGKLMENVALKEYVAISEDDAEDEGSKTDDNQQDILDTENIAIIYGCVDEENETLILEAMASIECENCEIYASKDGGEYQFIGNTDEYGYIEYSLTDDFESMEIYAVCCGLEGQRVESNRINIYCEYGNYSIPDPDTDYDGLDDYYELFISYTNHRLSDSDENGIVDGAEDIDGDGITNIEEYELSSHPLLSDTDGDELNDYDELFAYYTDVNLSDTDGDGANDKWELDNNTDPKVFDDSFSIRASSTSTEIVASVEMDVAGSMVETLVVEPIENHYFINDTVPGYIGSPFNFEIDGEFNEAIISFEFDEELLEDEDFVPAIYYFNEETQFLEELPTTVEGNVASSVVTHFSTYVLVEKTEYDDAWEDIKAPSDKEGVEEMNVIFVVDISYSMKGSNLTNAKNVVTNYIDNIRSNDISTKVGVVAFREYSFIKCNLTSDYDLAIQNVNDLSAYGGTNIYSGLNNAISTLYKNGEDSYNVIILLTDGGDASGKSDADYDLMLTKAKGFGIDIYTIGIGEVSDELLIKISDFGNGKYYYTDDSSGLYQIYEDVEGEVADYITDSNHDGISDYYTKLLCEGKLRIGTQGNIFEGISYAKVNACKDYDGDGLINGEELEIYRDEKTGYVYAYLYSNPFLRDSDGDGIIDPMDEAPLSPWSGLIIYESPKTDDNLKNGSDRPEDYEYGDKSNSKLLDMNYITYSDFSGKDKDYYIASWKSIAIDYSDGDMTSVALDMVHHSLDGTGTDYSNEILTENVIEHKSSKDYVKETKKRVIEHIEENNGDIYGLYYDANNRNASVIRKYFEEKEINMPVFDDAFAGLGFCVHGLYGNQIEIISYKFDGIKYECTLKFTYYDVFGLDSDDIEKNGAFVIKFGKIEGFRSWYILQHYDKYEGEVKPFITYVTFDETIKGEID